MAIKVSGTEVVSDSRQLTNISGLDATTKATLESGLTEVNANTLDGLNSTDFATSAQGSLADSAVQPNDNPSFGSVTVSGTVDGRDIAADGTKLDTIETNADVTDTANVAAAGALMKSGGTMTGNLILNADPTTALGAATKEYVDTIAASGIHYHAPVRVESPANLNANYDNGASGVGATLTNAGTLAAISIDGVALSLNDRTLVYHQTNSAHNGIYTVTTVGDGSTAWVLTRATDADSYGVSDPDALGEGDAFFVREGMTGAGELYVMNTSGTITFGTTPITFTVIAETAVYTGGTGVTLNGTQINIGQSVATNADVTFNNISVTGTVDSRDVAADGTKLDGIESGATGDQTAAEIRALVESATDSNVFTDADHTKLNGIEAGATADQTITAGSGLSGGGTGDVTLNHADTSTQASVNNSGATVIQDVTLDTYGHVTGLASTALTPATIGAATSAQGALADSATQPGDNISTLTNDAGFTTNVGDITGVTAGSGITGGGTSGTVTINHADTSSQASVNNSDGTVIQDITLDTYGHLTGITSTNLDSRYYTESEADSRFVNVTGDSFSGTLTYTGTGVALDTGGDNISLGNMEIVGTNGTNGWASQPGIYLPSADDFRIHAASGDATLYVDGEIYAGVGAASQKVFHDGYHPNADKWTTARTLSLTGDASGSTSWDGSGNASISVTVADDSHNHVISNVDGLQTALDGKLSTTGKAADSNLLDGLDSTAFYLASNPNGYTTNVGDITGVTAGTGLSGGGTSGTVTISHADTSTLSGTYGSTADGTKIDQITVDANGHVTSITTGATGDIQGVTAGSGLTGGGSSGTVTINHADTSSASSINGSGNTFIQDVTLDTYGHVTGLGVGSVTIPDASDYVLLEAWTPTSVGQKDFTWDENVYEGVHIYISGLRSFSADTLYCEILYDNGTTADSPYDYIYQRTVLENSSLWQNSEEASSHILTTGEVGGLAQQIPQTLSGDIKVLCPHNSSVNNYKTLFSIESNVHYLNLSSYQPHAVRSMSSVGPYAGYYSYKGLAYDGIRIGVGSPAWNYFAAGEGLVLVYGIKRS